MHDVFKSACQKSLCDGGKRDECAVSMNTKASLAEQSEEMDRGMD